MTWPTCISTTHHLHPYLLQTPFMGVLQHSKDGGSPYRLLRLLAKNHAKSRIHGLWSDVRSTPIGNFFENPNLMLMKLTLSLQQLLGDLDVDKHAFCLSDASFNLESQNSTKSSFTYVSFTLERGIQFRQCVGV
jgi:hypothetical protein